MMLGFFTALRENGILIGITDILTFYRGLSQGLAGDLDRLFLFARLCFVRRVSDFDAFERVFSSYFAGIEIPPVEEGDWQLFETKEFHKWLGEAWQNNELPMHPNFMDPAELMRRFWETVREQQERHSGGSKWIGPGGTSPFGHSGYSQGGFRIFGQSKNRSAMKVMGDRRYIQYSSDSTLSEDNMRAALAELKHLEPSGPYDVLDIDETIRKTATNGGEIELVFQRAVRDKLKVILMIDNGGSSMLPYAHRTQVLFQKMKTQLKSLQIFFFHNTVYSYVYTDVQRTRAKSLESVLKNDSDTRLFLVGDATMGPHELLSAYGNINWGDEDPEPSILQLKRLREKFPFSVWLNPMSDIQIENGSLTVQKIKNLFPMFSLTLRGLHNSVEYLNKMAG